MISSNTFKKGDIVYWCHHGGNADYSVHYGMVSDQFLDAVVIDYLEPMERRTINGIPIDEFEDNSYHKLPRGWTYNTSLFDLNFAEADEGYMNFMFDIKNPQNIKEAYDKGYLVKADTVFHGNVEAEITKEGYRIVKKYPYWRHRITYVSIVPDKVYFTFDEAQKEVDENITEFYRQASLSDYDWSVEQIDKTLSKWKYMVSASDLEVQEIRNFLLGMKNVEDIETRLFGGCVQWKYWKNKKWMNIEV